MQRTSQSGLYVKWGDRTEFFADTQDGTEQGTKRPAKRRVRAQQAGVSLRAVPAGLSGQKAAMGGRASRLLRRSGEEVPQSFGTASRSEVSCSIFASG